MIGGLQLQPAQRKQVKQASKQASKQVKSLFSFAADILTVNCSEDSLHFVSFLAACQPNKCCSSTETETGEYFTGNK